MWDPTVPDADSPTARALVALELVQSHPGITADRIAERLGVSSRAARRYVAILREAGIPIDSVSGPAGGYRPGRGLRPPPLVFSPGEALGLVMALLDAHPGVVDRADPVGSALAKILRALPESVAAQAESVRSTAASTPDRYAVRPDPTITLTLVEACAASRRVDLGYRTEAGRELALVVEPWAVVVRHRRWYLLCRTERGVRAYRVDRVWRASALEETFTPPADLDPVAAVEAHLGSGWEFEVEVLVEAPASSVERWTPRTMGVVEPVDERTCRLVGSTGNPSGYAADLAALPADFRVVRGEEVRTALATLAARLATASSPAP